MIVYISIGNSDDELTQRQWSDFVAVVDDTLVGAHKRDSATVHGSWRSPSDARWQNACWCVEIGYDDVAEALRSALRDYAGIYHQDSIAWAEVKTTEFLGAPIAATT